MRRLRTAISPQDPALSFNLDFVQFCDSKMLMNVSLRASYQHFAVANLYKVEMLLPIPNVFQNFGAVVLP